MKADHTLIARILKIGCLPALLIFALDARAADWHVSPQGDDEGLGTVQSPFASISHALSRANEGDRILLQRGAVFREGGLHVGPNLQMEPYGNPSLANPVIRGSIVVSAFETWGESGTMRANLPSLEGVGLLFLNGNFATLARHPDQSWIRTLPGTTNTSIRSNLSHPAGTWTGAQVRWRKWSWWYETRPISTDHGGGTLQLGGESPISDLVGIDSGFYIDNSLQALDAAGEWYWNPAQKQLYLRFPEGGTPANTLVEAVVRETALFLDQATIDSVDVEHFITSGIEINRNSTLRNCRIRHIGQTGIQGTWWCGSSVIENCTIEDVLNTGISWIENPTGSGNTRIEGNRLSRIGFRNGLGGSSPWSAAGIIVYVAPTDGRAVSVSGNRIEDTGYAGIILGSDGQRVERNVFRRCMSTLNDGAAIYANCHRSQIRDNIILDTVGDMESAQPFFPLGHGIWIEFLSQFADSVVTGNTVYGSGGNGLFLPNNFRCTVTDNTFLSNRLAGIQLSAQNNGTPLNQAHLIERNLMGIGHRPWSSDRPENLASWAQPDDHALGFDLDGRNIDFGSLSGNILLTRDGLDLIRNSASGDLTLTEWQNNQPSWADSSAQDLRGHAVLFINDRNESFSFSLPQGIEWILLNGSPAGQNLSLQAFRSQVLFAPEGAITALPGYLLSSEFTSNRPPQLEVIGNRQLAAGTTLNLSIEATDPDNDPLNFSASGDEAP
jgi:parallel beta-helix repeat protein